MAANTVLSEFRSLFEEAFQDVHGEDFSIYNSDLQDKLEKLVKANQEKLKPLMAHIQNYPKWDKNLCRGELHAKYAMWKEELDKRRLHPENYVCVSRKKLSERNQELIDILNKSYPWYVVRPLREIIDWQSRFEKELLQPSTSSADKETEK